MKINALLHRDGPVGVKDENVPFDRTPRHKEYDDHVERCIDERPKHGKKQLWTREEHWFGKSE